MTVMNCVHELGGALRQLCHLGRRQRVPLQRFAQLFQQIGEEGLRFGIEPILLRSSSEIVSKWLRTAAAEFGRPDGSGMLMLPSMGDER